MYNKELDDEYEYKEGWYDEYGEPATSEVEAEIDARLAKWGPGPLDIDLSYEPDCAFCGEVFEWDTEDHDGMPPPVDFNCEQETGEFCASIPLDEPVAIL